MMLYRLVKSSSPCVPINKNKGLRHFGVIFYLWLDHYRDAQY